MKVRDIVAQLQSQGYTVTTRARSVKEGSGLRITSINGKKFKGSTGNEYARSLLGVELSSVQKRHLESIKNPKNVFGNVKKNLTQVDDATKRKIRNLQAKFRKRGIKEGVPTLRNYRYNLNTFGKAEADRLLESAGRYVKGVAYLKNIQALIERMINDQSTHWNDDIEEAKNIIQNYYNLGAPNFLDTQLNDIYDYLYVYEQRINNAKDSKAAAKSLLSYVKSCQSSWR